LTGRYVRDNRTCTTAITPVSARQCRTRKKPDPEPPGWAGLRVGPRQGHRLL